MGGLFRLNLLSVFFLLPPIALRAGENQTFVMPDGSIQLTAGSTWTQYQSDQANAPPLQLSDGDGQLFIQAYAVPQSDFASDLKGFAKMSFKQFTRMDSTATMSELNPIQINGKPALESEVHWTDSSKFRYAGLVTYIATDQYFAEVRACTRQSKFKESLPYLRDIVTTVREAPRHVAQDNGPSTRSSESMTASDSQTKIFCASDDSIEITVGPQWTRYLDNDRSNTLDITNELYQQFIQGSACLRADYASDLKGFAQAEAERLAGIIPNATTSDPIAIKLNGNKAIQWKGHWIDSDGFRWAGLVTCIATRRYFVEIRATVHESGLKDCLPLFSGFLGTVREAPGQPHDDDDSSTQPARE